jgi:hypothetical protein
VAALRQAALPKLDSRVLAIHGGQEFFETFGCDWYRVRNHFCSHVLGPLIRQSMDRELKVCRAAVEHDHVFERSFHGPNSTHASFRPRVVGFHSRENGQHFFFETRNKIEAERKKSVSAFYGAILFFSGNNAGANGTRFDARESETQKLQGNKQQKN